MGTLLGEQGKLSEASTLFKKAMTVVHGAGSERGALMMVLRAYEKFLIACTAAPLLTVHNPTEGQKGGQSKDEEEDYAKTLAAVSSRLQKLTTSS